MARAWGLLSESDPGKILPSAFSASSRSIAARYSSLV
jgi:hypothetical protein